MKAYNIYKAQEIGDQKIDTVNITIAIPFPEIDHELTLKDSMKEVEQIFQKEAQDLFNALEGSLPGGTFNRLLALMLQHKAGHFVIRG